MRFGELLSGAGLECPDGISTLTVSGIVTDSRRVIKDCIFVCLSGSVYDGHDYIESAVEAGAAVIVAEKVRGECVGGAATILVENTRHTASLLYSVWYGEPAKDLKIIGVTGTNGKTSVASMLLEIFESAGHECGFIGTVGCFSKNKTELLWDEGRASNMTTPSPDMLYRALARMRDDGVEYVFMEVSSHALAQCRTDAISFEAAVFTNLTEDHLDFHKNMEEYYRAKEKLFTQSRRAVVNIDDTAGRRLVRSLEENGGFFKTCSLTKGDFCALVTRKNGANGTEYILKTPDGAYRVSLPLCGDFQVINSLEAAATALVCGVPAETVVSALEGIVGVRGRMEALRLHKAQDIHVFIDYAHTPDALEKLLLSVRDFREAGSRIVLLFGCGGEREREKRRLMGQIASRLADFVVVTSDNSRGEPTVDIISQVVKGIDKEKQYAVIENRREAIERAIREYTRPGDILILAGKGHETYQIDAEGKHPFDEREIVRQIFGELYS